MFDIQPTPFDLQFRLGRIPVRVHPGFWLIGTLGGWNPDDLRLTFLWVVCLFVSILVHELGHALISEAYRWPSEILLYHLGGLTFSQRYFGNTPWKSIAVSIAGPCAGFALYGLIRLGVRYWPGSPRDWNEYVQFAIVQLIYINLWWGIVNLAPVLPLDGGQILRSLLEWLRLRDHEQIALKVSIVAGALLALLFFRLRFEFAGFLFGMFTVFNIVALRQPRGRW
jgi:stage IV sporulation protein FB